MRPPDAIGIGFRRCASSWLHACLNEHPAIGKIPNGIHYFSEHLDKGAEWYLQQFAPFANKEVVVDLSVSYAYPENIQKFVEHIPKVAPEAKIFALVRNPIERAYSDYRRSVFLEEFPPETTFEKALEQSPILLERGQYGYLLQMVLSVVPENKLKIFFYDDVKTKPDQFWQDICGFLGISPEFVPNRLHTAIGHTAPPKNPKLHRYIRRVNQGATNVAQGVGLGQLWRSLKTTRLWHRAVDINIQKQEEIQPETRRYLVAYYAEDVAFLTKLSKRNLSGWLK